MGASWLCVDASSYGLLFKPHSRWGFLTRSGTELDSLTTGTLLGKVAHQLDALPAWMLGNIVRSRVDHEFVNLDNNASIKGSKTVLDAFRGDRHTATFVDEAASIPSLNMMSASLNNVTDCLIYVSTPKGKSGLYAKICLGDGFETHETGEQGLGWMIHTLHYSQRPDRDPDTTEGRQWRESKQADCTPEEWAQEWEIDFEVSQPDRILPEFSTRTHTYSEDEHRSVLEWIRRVCPVTPLLIEAWDFGEGVSQTSVVHAYWVPPYTLEGDDTVYGDFIYYLDYGTWQATPYDEILADLAEMGWYTKDNPRGRRPDVRIGDAYGKSKGADQESWFSFFSYANVDLQSRTLAGRLKRALMTMRVRARDKKILISPACIEKFNPRLPSLGEALEQYQYDARTGKPKKHSEYSHLFDAALFAADYVWAPSYIEVKKQS